MQEDSTRSGVSAQRGGSFATEAFVICSLVAAGAAAAVGAWKESATFCIEALQKIRAFPSEETRQSLAPLETSAMVQLFEAQSHSDLPAAHKSFSELEKRLSGSLGLLDAEELERRELPPLRRTRRTAGSKAGGAVGGNSLHSVGVAEKQIPPGTQAGRTRKRKRKPRYPKGFDPSKPSIPPDPERWLPKHERLVASRKRAHASIRACMQSSSLGGKALPPSSRFSVCCEPWVRAGVSGVVTKKCCEGEKSVFAEGLKEPSAQVRRAFSPNST